MRFRDRLRQWLFPEIFSGEPQPHENRDLASGPLIKEARKRGVLKVNTNPSMGIGVDGDRVVLDPFGNGSFLWVDADGAELMGVVLLSCSQQIRANKGSQPSDARDAGERRENAVDVRGYSFLVHTSKGMFRFDKQLPGAFLNPGEDVVAASVQFTLTSEGDVVCGEGWDRAL